MKYFVIITRWNSEKATKVREIAGAFERFHHAAIFKKAYEEEFKAHAEIVEADKWLNGRA